ncbi:uncharacterized protein LOC129289231 [Prosopis cineraria]|uniref:uncharacterized protein LOC129289231 n=1 Tax=Prosopis cineraria TaxID=364024 RepID=UPI00240FFA76|nr:uncharacterized protein LOC129289231 [Prosopis cineraria]
MELLKDYDCIIRYHPGKANAVIDALSRKSMGSLAHVIAIRRPFMQEIHTLEQDGVELEIDEKGVFLAHMQDRSSLIDQIKATQNSDPKLAQSRQKSYVDCHHRELKFMVGDKVVLKISPIKGIIRFRNKGKLSPRYIGPFKILERVGVVAYCLALPPELVGIHPVFHVSMLRKYLYDPSHVVETQKVQINEDLTYEEVPVAILDRQIKKLRLKEIASVKVLWRNHSIKEATWEIETEIRDKYPHLF